MPSTPMARAGGRKMEAAATARLIRNSTTAITSKVMVVRWARFERGTPQTADFSALTVHEHRLRLVLIIQIIGGVDRLQQQSPVLLVELCLPGKMAQIIGAGCLAAFFDRRLLKSRFGIRPGILSGAVRQAQQSGLDRLRLVRLGVTQLERS